MDGGREARSRSRVAPRRANALSILIGEGLREGRPSPSRLSRIYAAAVSESKISDSIEDNFASAFSHNSNGVAQKCRCQKGSSGFPHFSKTQKLQILVLDNVQILYCISQGRIQFTKNYYNHLENKPK